MREIVSLCGKAPGNSGEMGSNPIPFLLFFREKNNFYNERKAVDYTA